MATKKTESDKIATAKSELSKTAQNAEKMSATRLAKANGDTPKESAKDKRQKQVNMILEEAEKKGIKTNFFFSTTLNRYLTQLDILTNLEAKIIEDGELVTKEYVKGRENLYVNPAVSEYNKTSTAANGTVATLMKILTSLNSDNPEGASKLEKMLKKLNSSDADKDLNDVSADND